MFNTHYREIRKVPGHFEKKNAKNTKARGELIKHGGVLRKLHPEHSRRG